MKCEEFSKFTQSFLDEDLPLQSAKEWHQHLDECPSCRKEVEVYQKCIGMMQRFMGEELPPQTLMEKLKKKLGEDCFDFCLPKK